MKVIYHIGVQRDLDLAWNYYEEASPGLGDRFFAEFLTIIEGIVKHPRRWPPTTKGRRVAQFDCFPFKLLYRVERDRIKVLVVRHQKRHPSFGDWRK